MNRWSKEKMGNKMKTVFAEQGCIIFGTLLLAISINLFLAPNKISAGGVTSVGTVLLHLFHIKLSVTNLVCNAVLFLLGYRYLGKYAVAKTVSGTLFLSLFLELTSYLPIYKGEMLIALIMGGFLMGLGVGFVIRVNASTGGSDFAALIIKRFFPHVATANLILCIDGIIVILAGIIFKSFEITVYSLLALYISSKITDIVVVFGERAKSVQIFSPDNELIAEKIMTKFERGVSGLHCKGMYSKDDGYMLLCVVSPKEVPRVIDTVKKIDRNAFVVIEDALQVYGEGFKSI